jgi:hypothetical protein
MRRMFLLTTVAVALAPAAGHAATARFTATFEAQRTVEWDQPYGVGLKDCKGDHYVEQRGDETWTAKSRTPFKVVVKKLPGVTFWQFGGGIEAAGMVTRNWTYRAGTTGGWCGGESTEPPGDRDCGTRLPTYQLMFTALNTSIDWSASFAPWMNKEKLYYDNCLLLVPPGMSVDSPPRLTGKAPAKALFNPKRKTIVVRASKDYGPESTPLSNLGVALTTSGHMTWTLTLNRR